MKKYLITCSHNRYSVINHGLVEIDDRGWVGGETPIEDFGMWNISDVPFPSSESEILDIFIGLLKESEDRYKRD